MNQSAHADNTNQNQHPTITK
jgi:hypothetical protein